MKKLKVLFVATVASHIRAFHLPYLKWFQQQGYETHVACEGELALPFVDVLHSIPLHRSPFALDNLKAMLQLRCIMQKNHFELIHCHTPMGGVVGRLAGFGLSAKAQIVYTAHGFHFYKGAPKKNWLLYFPIEWLLALKTDCLITMNKEDYITAKSKYFPANIVEYVPGVGVDLQRFTLLSEADRTSERRKHGFSDDEKILIYAAEFSKRKNQALLLKSVALLFHQQPELRIRLLLAGDGALRASCEEQARQLGIDHLVDFLGYRQDLHELLPLCDVAVASSIQEGLPVNVIEALASGLPVVASDIRGHRDLIKPFSNGLLVKLGNGEERRFARALKRVMDEPRNDMAIKCRRSALPYGEAAVLPRMAEIYRQFI